MKSIKLIILTSLVLSIGTQVFAQFGTGYKCNPMLQTGTPMKPAGMGFATDIPASYTLKVYSPYVKSQGIYPSCSGWAVSYEALTIQFAIAYGLKDRNHITAKAFCPYYSYNKEQPVDPFCKTGKDASLMMNTLKNEGGKKFYLPLLGCGTTLADEFAYASRYYKIKEFYTLNTWPKDVMFDEKDMKGSWKKFFDAAHPLDLTFVKQCIANKFPVVFGAALPTSFYTAGEFWEPTAEEKADPSAAIMGNTGDHRLHAMTVIGYDDNKFGGAFEVMNSWSESWGNNGYFWVKYDDFKMYAFSAMVMELFPTEYEIAGRTGMVWGDCKNTYSYYRFNNGESYEGQFMDGKFHGYGIYTWPNGQVYAGQWKMGKRQGEATCYFEGGTFGQAIYNADTFVSGYNEEIYVNGNTYKGYFKDGQYDGYGVYTFSAGGKYMAMFSNGNLNGLGKYFAADGSVFIGYYTDGKRNGKGVYVSADGKISGGEWAYGSYISGKTYGFASGMNMNTGVEMSSNMYLSADCQSGNCLMGEGKRITDNGTTYTGTFVDGLEDGKGEMVYSDATYNGSWKQGKEHGIGEMRFPNGAVIISEFKKGKLEGYLLRYDNAGNMAVYLFKDGEKVSGFTQFSATPASGSSMNVSSAPLKITNIVNEIK